MKDNPIMHLSLDLVPRQSSAIPINYRLCLQRVWCQRQKTSAGVMVLPPPSVTLWK